MATTTVTSTAISQSVVQDRGAKPHPTAIVVIRPEPSTHGKVVKLSQIDQIAPRDYISTLLFFRLPKDVNLHHTLTAIELGLVETVKEIPQLASTVTRSNNTREELELRYDASKGATLTWKDYTSPELSGEWLSGSFEDLERQHFPLSKLPRRLVHGLWAIKETEALPSLVVQVSIIDGGLILGSCFHHTVGDGKCTFLYNELFASNTTAVSSRLLHPNSFSLISPATRIEFLERVDVVGEEAGVLLDDFPDWKRAGQGFESEQSLELKPASRADFATYYISHENIGRLKSRLSSTSGFRPCTSEAIAAFLWRHVVLARNIDAKRYPEAKLSMTVDTRLRMDPKVPGTYWGNLAEPNAVARIPVPVLCADSAWSTSESSEKIPLSNLCQSPMAVSSPSSLSSVHGATGSSNNVLALTAQLVRASIAAVDNKAVRRLSSLLKGMPTATTLTWNVNRWPGPDMLIVFVQHLRFNDLDFGPLLGGCSHAFRPTVGDNEGKPDGRCFVLPPRKCDGKGLEVLVQYDPETLLRLRQNSEWGEFFEWRN